MKFLFLIALIITFNVINPQKGFSQSPPDSCLKMICPDSTWMVYDDVNDKFYTCGAVNHDSIKVDSCYGSPTYGLKYAKRFFAVGFKNYPFANAIPIDSIYTSSTIIDNHTKQQIQDLETKFGLFKFLRQFEESDDTDYDIYSAGYVYVALNNYICKDSLIYYLKNTVDSVDGVQLLYTAEKYDGIYGNANELKFQIENYFPNPVKDYLIIKEIENICKIELFTIEGIKFLETEFQEKIDVSSLTPGLYFIKANNKYFKFIKN